MFWLQMPGFVATKMPENFSSWLVNNKSRFDAKMRAGKLKNKERTEFLRGVSHIATSSPSSSSWWRSSSHTLNLNVTRTVEIMMWCKENETEEMVYRNSQCKHFMPTTGLVWHILPEGFLQLSTAPHGLLTERKRPQQTEKAPVRSKWTLSKERWSSTCKVWPEGGARVTARRSQNVLFLLRRVHKSYFQINPSK